MSPSPAPQRRSSGVQRWILASLALIAMVSLGFAIHHGIVIGRAKRARADAEYNVLRDIRTIYHAQREYYVQNPFLGFPCSLQVLGGMPAPGAPRTDPTSKSAQLLDDSLASGHADGYIFSLSNCTRLENVGFNGYTDYHLTAIPDFTAPPGVAGFCVDDDVENLVPGEWTVDRPDIRMDPAGGSHCTEPEPKLY